MTVTFTNKQAQFSLDITAKLRKEVEQQAATIAALRELVTTAIIYFDAKQPHEKSWMLRARVLLAEMAAQS